MSLAGFEPAHTRLEDERSSPLSYRPATAKAMEGFEPSQSRLRDGCSASWSYIAANRELVGARGQAAPLAPRSRGSRRSAGDEPSAPLEAVSY